MAAVAGIFDSALDADKALNELHSRGYGDKVTVIEGGAGNTREVSGVPRPLDEHAAASTPLAHVGENLALAASLDSSLANNVRPDLAAIELPPEEADFFNRALTHGGSTLVAVDVGAGQRDEVCEILRRAGGRTAQD